MKKNINKYGKNVVDDDEEVEKKGEQTRMFALHIHIQFFDDDDEKPKKNYNVFISMTCPVCVCVW